MRLAKGSDYRRNVYKKKFPKLIQKAEYLNISKLGSGNIEFRGGITAITGLNGVGKSTLLRLIKESISKSDLKAYGQGSPSPMCTLTGNISEESEIGFLDPSSYAEYLCKNIYSQTNLNELLEAVTPKELTGDERADLSVLIGRNYINVLVYELDQFGDEPVPYFQVECDGIKYGAEDMGAGELSLHIMFWTLQSFEPSGALLIEEPENRISTTSQHAVVNIFSKYAVKNHIWIIFTTHSNTILSYVPNEHRRILSRGTGVVKVYDTPSNFQLRTFFRSTSLYSGILLVEDEVAVSFARAWIGYTEPTILNRYEIINGNSAGEISTILKTMPAQSTWFKLVGLFDPDMRERLPEKRFFKLPYSFLPGTESPELEFISLATRSISVIADRAGKTTSDIEFLLASAEGKNHHDWLSYIAEETSLSKDVLCEIFFDEWCLVPGNEALSNAAMTELKGVLSWAE